MKRKKTVILIASLLILVSAGIYFYYGFLFKEARNIETEEASLSISATRLLHDYNSNPQKADSLYLNKTIEVTGITTKETDSAIVLENIIFCQFDQKLKHKLINHEVTVKGKCIGYDELFQEVKLDQCTLINKPNN